MRFPVYPNVYESFSLKKGGNSKAWKGDEDMKTPKKFNIEKYVMPMLLLLHILGASVGVQADEPRKMNLKALLEEAETQNPQIQAARSRWKSVQDTIEARRALPDPQLSYTYFVESVETRVGPQRHIVGARQKFPFYGKRDLRAEIASKEAQTLMAVYEAVKQEVSRNVKKRFYDLFYITKSIDITENEKEILQRFERIARTKYETGKGSQQNILKVHVEISRLKDKLLTLNNRKDTLRTLLNTLLNRPADAPMGKPEQPYLRQFSYIRGQLLRMAREHRPELKAGVSQIEQSDKALNLAKKDYYPDFTIGANYIENDDGPLSVSDNGKDAFNVMVSINIPIWKTKLSAQVASATKMIQSRKARYQAILNQTDFEVTDAYLKVQTARDKFQLYQNVLFPQAEQSLRSAEAGYINGIVNFLDLLDAERVLLQIQFGYWKAYADYLKHIADMERVVGVSLAEIPPEKAPLDTEEG